MRALYSEKLLLLPFTYQVSFRKFFCPFFIFVLLFFYRNAGALLGEISPPFYLPGERLLGKFAQFFYFYFYLFKHLCTYQVNDYRASFQHVRPPLPPGTRGFFFPPFFFLHHSAPVASWDARCNACRHHEVVWFR